MSWWMVSVDLCSGFGLASQEAANDGRKLRAKRIAVADQGLAGALAAEVDPVERAFAAVTIFPKH